MHGEAFDGARKMITDSGLDPAGSWDALDMGGANINGTARQLLPNATWTGLDLEAGPGVDVVDDARTWKPVRQFDVVMCTELLEHVEFWEKVLYTIRAALKPGGVMVLTCASNGRPAHGARGGPAPEPGEWYGNVDFEHLGLVMGALFTDYQVTFNPNPGDCYAWGRA